jgi:dihydrofolate reductase
MTSAEIKRHTVFYAACSIDGYIAGPAGDMDWAEKYLATGEDFGYLRLVQECSAILMGRKTFDFEVDADPNMDRILPTYVYTSQPMRFDGVNPRQVTFVTGPLADVVERITTEHPGKLFVSGGAQLVNGLLAERLLDEIILFICPDVLGAGVRLWGDSAKNAKLALLDSKQYESGLVRLRFSVDA